MIPRANVLFGLCLLAGLLVLNAGCATSHGRPPLSKMTNQWTKYYSEKGDQIDHQLKFVDEFEKKRAGDKKQGIEAYTSEQLRLERNEIIGRLITIAEEVHATIDENLRNSRAYGNVFMDAAQIVTTGLSVLANSAATADKFATAALASKGFQESVDKRLFYEHATTAVVNQMHLLRVEAKKPLIAGLSRTIDDYPLSIAISEWGTYFLSGNVTEALSRMGTDAKAKELKLLEIIADLLALGKDETGTGTAEIEAAHKKAEAGAAEADADRAERVAVILGLQGRVSSHLDLVDTLDAQKAIDLVTNPPHTNAAIQAAVAARDPGNLRFSDGNAAKQIIKMMMVMSKRELAVTRAWEGALTALTN